MKICEVPDDVFVRVLKNLENEYKVLEDAVSKILRKDDELYKELETPEEEKRLFRLAKKRDKASKDLTQIKQMKDAQGEVLTEFWIRSRTDGKHTLKSC